MKLISRGGCSEDQEEAWWAEGRGGQRRLLPGGGDSEPWPVLEERQPSEEVREGCSRPGAAGATVPEEMS